MPKYSWTRRFRNLVSQPHDVWPWYGVVPLRNFRGQPRDRFANDRQPLGDRVAKSLVGQESGFSAGLTARSTRRPSRAVSSRIIAETPSSPGRAPGRKSTRRSTSLSGRISPRAAEPKRDNSLTWWRRKSRQSRPPATRLQQRWSRVSSLEPLSVSPQEKTRRAPLRHH